MNFSYITIGRDRNGKMQYKYVKTTSFFFILVQTNIKDANRNTTEEMIHSSLTHADRIIMLKT